MTETAASDAAPADAGTAHRQQTRARHPDAVGQADRDGVRVSYEVYGSGDPTILLLPTWSIVDSRFWKGQIPYLARHFRVIAFDGRGNGGSDRPAGASAYGITEFALDALAVLDATDTERAALVALSCGALWATLLAADHPERVDSVTYISPAVALAPGHPERDVSPFEDKIENDREWAKYNRLYWERDFPGFLEFFFAKCFNEPHSTKQIEDCVGWGLQTTPQTLADATRGIGLLRDELFRETCARVRCPTLVIHGDNDLVRPLAQGDALARATGGELVTLQGSGHIPNSRDPVRINLLVREFVGRGTPTSAWTRARSRAKRVLFVSSPIGLGHARRDLAVADQLRGLAPGLEVVWLAQHPVTELLEARGECIHPASAELASESAHFQAESSGHRLDCFGALRRMDEILLANFMVFHDLVTSEAFDLWVGDEAWDVDYFLHENPELKTAAYAWMTDFVGYLPTVEGGEREAFLTADYNAEMIEQIARFPRVRDRSIFVGEPEDVIPGRFGPGCRGSGSGPNGITASRVTSQALTPPRSQTAGPCGPSTATDPTSAFASSPSVARGSAQSFCVA